MVHHLHATHVVTVRFSPKDDLSLALTKYAPLDYSVSSMFWKHCELIKCKSFCSQTSSCPSFPDMIYIYWHESEVWVSRRRWWMWGSSQQALLHHNPAETHIFLFLTVDSSSRRQWESAALLAALWGATMPTHAHHDKDAQVLFDWQLTLDAKMLIVS